MRAQGEARSAELIGEAMRSNKGFLQLRRLEAARDIVNLLATSGNRVMLDAQSLLLNGKRERTTLATHPDSFRSSYWGRCEGSSASEEVKCVSNSSMRCNTYVFSAPSGSVSAVTTCILFTCSRDETRYSRLLDFKSSRASPTFLTSGGIN